MNGCCSGFVNLRNRLLILYGSLYLLLVSSGYPELVLFFFGSWQLLFTGEDRLFVAFKLEHLLTHFCVRGFEIYCC